MHLFRWAAALAAVFLAMPAVAQTTATSVQFPAGFAPGSAPCVKAADGTCVPVSAANPLPASSVVTAASSTPATGTVTATNVTPTSGTGTLTSGTAVIPFTPTLGLPVRVILRGGATFSAYVGTSVDGCVTINPLTVAGQQWATFNGSANEFVDTPETTATAANIRYCLVITVTSGTETYGVRQ